MRLLLIRHGETSANAEGRLQGHLGTPLNERGRQQSEALAERIAAAGIDALYTSPLPRAIETATPIQARRRLTAQHRPGLMERYMGELQGLTREEIRASFPDYVRARAEGRPVNVPGYESDKAFNERVAQVIDEIAEAHAGQTVAAVTHGGVIAAMCRRTLQMPVVRPGPFVIDNASITTFHVRDDGDPPARPRVHIVALNDTCHLDGLGPDAP